MLVNNSASSFPLNRFSIPVKKSKGTITFQKLPCRDIFFKGKKNRTESAIKLIEHGESASNALIITLKGADFGAEVQSVILHALEGAIPFVNIAVKTTGMYHAVGQWSVKEDKKKLKAAIDQFFKNPNSRNLKNWQRVQDDKGFKNDGLSWYEEIIAVNMYSKAVHDFHHAADHVSGHSAPSLLGQKDLEQAIRCKTTALACMFLFNNSDIPSFYMGPGLSRMGHPVAKYGKQMLGCFDNSLSKRFDLMTAIKIADLYHTQFDKEQLANFYYHLSQVVFKGYQQDRDIRPLLLFRALLKRHFTDEEASKYLQIPAHIRSDYGIQKGLADDPNDWAHIYKDWDYLRDEQSHFRFAQSSGPTEYTKLLRELYFTPEEHIKYAALNGRKFWAKPYPKIMQHLDEYKAEKPKYRTWAKMHLMSSTVDSVKKTMLLPSEELTSDPYQKLAKEWASIEHDYQYGENRAADELRIQNATLKTLRTLLMDPDAAIRQAGEELAKVLSVSKEELASTVQNRLEESD